MHKFHRSRIEKLLEDADGEEFRSDVFDDEHENDNYLQISGKETVEMLQRR